MEPSPSRPSSVPRLRLLTAPALVQPNEIRFVPERRFCLAALLALTPHGLTRDEVAALFWPDRTQTAARSNLRKLILELRRLDLPGILLDGNRLAWPVVSDAGEMLAGQGPAGTWSEPLPGLGGHDSVAFDEWLLALRARLYEAWQERQRVLAGGDDALQARIAAEALLAQFPDDAEAQRLAARTRRALGSDGAARPGAGRRRDDVAGEEPDLVGRGAELAELQALLRERRCRLLTLLGPGGVGKSALALTLLQRPGALEADSVHWIALEDLQHTTQVPLRIARELGAKVGPCSDGWDECLAALRGRQVLLILDNAEHLPDLPAWLARLDAALPALRLLVTSRHRLGLSQEWVMPLAPLQPAAAQRLFIAAARRAPARAPVDAADPAVEALVELVGRLPLALRLAAAWTRHLAPATLLEQLRRSTDLLQASESVDEHPAHHSLQACFEHSWAQLDLALRRALAALSIAAGDMHLHVAMAAAQASAAQLASLADASLIDIQSDGRVTMHPLLRRFSRTRLEAEPADLQAAQARHAQALATLLQPYADFDNVDLTVAVRAISPERQQIMQAWACALVLQRADWLQVYAPTLSGLAQAEGGVDAVLQLFDQACCAMPGWPSAPAAACADVMLEQGALHFWRGDHDRCEDAARRALALARAARMERPQSQALNLLALVALRRGQTQDAARLLERALAFARRAAPAGQVAVLSGNLSGILRELGQLDRAHAHARQALQAHRSRGSAIGEVAMLADLAQLAQLQGRFEEAYEWVCQAEQISQRHAMALRRVSLLAFKAAIRFDQGRLDEADAMAASALAALQASGGRHYHESSLRRLLAELALARRDPEQARVQLRLACAQVGPLAKDVNARGLLWSLAALADYGGDADLAAALAQRAERNRPPQAVLLPRCAAMRARWPAPPEPPADDAELQRAIDRLLG